MQFIEISLKRIWTCYWFVVLIQVMFLIMFWYSTCFLCLNGRRQKQGLLSWYQIKSKSKGFWYGWKHMNSSLFEFTCIEWTILRLNVQAITAIDVKGAQKEWNEMIQSYTVHYNCWRMWTNSFAVWMQVLALRQAFNQH